MIGRETKTYRLIWGSLQSAGCYFIERKSDGHATYWDTGLEGQEAGERLCQLADADFDSECDGMEFHP